jgi:hypothetical protein
MSVRHEKVGQGVPELYRRKLILAIVVFPSQNNNIVQCVFGVLQPWEIKIFSSALGRPDDPWQVSC